MKPKAPKLLEDVRDAAAFICEAVRDKTFQGYQRDRLPRQAMERNFEIIGEAMNRSTLHDPDTAAGMSKHRQIIDFRDVLFHRYDLIDHRVVGAPSAKRCRYCWGRSRRFCARRIKLS